MTRTSGDLGPRLLRHYLPLALASSVVLVLFVTLPRPFDSSKYSGGDIFSGTFPKDFPAGQTGQHGGGQPRRPQGGGHQSRQQHGGGQQPPQQQGGDQAPSVGPSAEEVDDRSFVRRFTTGSGYVALGLLALTLLIGPANLLRRRRNPVSGYLRRDVGVSTAVVSGVHVIVSLKVHGSGQIRDFANFFVADGSPLTNSFRLGNWTGLAALVIRRRVARAVQRRRPAQAQSQELEAAPALQLRLVRAGRRARVLLRRTVTGDIAVHDLALHRRHRGRRRTGHWDLAVPTAVRSQNRRASVGGSQRALRCVSCVRFSVRRS